MTFQEYLSQDGLKKSYNVQVKKSDAYWFKPAIDNRYDYEVCLEIHGDYFNYVTKVGSNHLFTVDQDGNAKALSCFVLDWDEKKLVDDYLLKQQSNNVMDQLSNKDISKVVFPKINSVFSVKSF